MKQSKKKQNKEYTGLFTSQVLQSLALKIFITVRKQQKWLFEMWHDKVGLNSLLFMLHDKLEIESSTPNSICYPRGDTYKL